MRAQRLEIGQAFEVINGVDVIARHTLAGKRARVTLPEHAASVRAADAATRRPQWSKKAFERLPVNTAVAGGFRGLLDAPVVQVRDLAEFDVAVAAA